MVQVELRVVSGSQAGSSIPLNAGKFLIGREHDCHLRPNSDLVSRHHCAFTLDDYSIRLRDLGSTNGTFVNGEQIHETTVLQPGDRVSVGKLDLIVVIDGQPSAIEETLHSHRDDTVLAGVSARAGGGEDSSLDIATMADELAQLEDDTKFELPAAVPAAADSAAAAAPVDTQEFAAAAAGYPQYAPNPWMAPPQFPYPTAYPQYPGMPYGYGYPYPGVPQPPPGYGYPPAPQAPEPQQPEPAPAAPSGLPEIRLPDPATTGAKPPEPPQPKAADSGAGKPKPHIPTAAQDIINSYLNRRPKTE